MFIELFSEETNAWMLYNTSHFVTVEMYDDPNENDELFKTGICVQLSDGRVDVVLFGVSYKDFIGLLSSESDSIILRDKKYL